MDKQIRERIKQIQQGQIPIGYKRTEFGIFPCDWQIVELSKLLDFKNGVNAPKEKYNCGVKMISVMDILKEYPITYDSIIGKVDIEDSVLREYDVAYGDILFQRSSETFDDAGKANVYLDKKIATYSGFVIRGKKKFDYEPYFLNEMLRMPFVRKQIVRSAAGAQHINIGQESLENIVVCLATKREQEIISEILGKWDDAIKFVEKIIEDFQTKRRYLLKEVFEEKTESTKIRIGDFIQEQSERNKTGITNIKSVSNKRGFIDQRNQFSKIVASADVSNYKVVKKHNIAYNPSRINVGSIAIYEDDEPGVVSPMYIVFSCIGISPKFLLLLLETDRGKYEIESLLSGSVRNTLSYSDLCEVQLFLPHLDESIVLKTFSLIETTIQMYENYLKRVKVQRSTLQRYLLNGMVRV